MEIMDKMKSIRYGWLDKNSNKHIDDDGDFKNDYILQTPDEVLTNKLGVCWDQVELERYLFEKKNIKVKTYFIIYCEGICSTHTFLTYKIGKNYYWFEHAWELFSGIHKYSREKELLLDVKNKYIENELNDDFINEKLEIYEYKKPSFHISVQDFCEHCCKCKKVIL